MTLEEVRKKLSEIKMKGYIRTLRKGPTGIGYTLEKLLEIKEMELLKKYFMHRRGGPFPSCGGVSGAA